MKTLTENDGIAPGRRTEDRTRDPLLVSERAPIRLDQPITLTWVFSRLAPTVPVSPRETPSLRARQGHAMANGDCRVCGGTGHWYTNKKVKCTACNGTGNAGGK